MNENDQQVYGRLLEANSFSSHGFDRMCKHLEYLLEDNRWQKVGSGFTDLSDFVRTIDLSAFKFDTAKRRRLAEKMKLAGASNVAIADAVKVTETTIRRDTRQDVEQEQSPTEAATNTDTRQDVEVVTNNGSESVTEKKPSQKKEIAMEVEHIFTICQKSMKRMRSKAAQEQFKTALLAVLSQKLNPSKPLTGKEAMRNWKESIARYILEKNKS
jgi:hypothetical protein